MKRPSKKRGTGTWPGAKLEKTLEKKCRELAESRGCELYKVAFRNRVGFPDRLLVVPCRPFALVALLEFKRPGGVVRAHQRLVHEELRRPGLMVGVIDEYEQFEKVVDELQRLARLST